MELQACLMHLQGLDGGLRRHSRCLQREIAGEEREERNKQIRKEGGETDKGLIVWLPAACHQCEIAGPQRPSTTTFTGESLL